MQHSDPSMIRTSEKDKMKLSNHGQISQPHSLLAIPTKQYGLKVYAIIAVLVVFGQILTGQQSDAAAAAESQRRPNIVFILADDLGYRELGSFGQELIKTPHLDRLASQGMKLTQHYCGNAVCAPSRCVLVTAKHPGHAYVRSNKGTPPEGQWPIPDDEVTIFELMQKQGYVTGAFGKWGLGGPASTGEPLRQGVNRFFGYNCQSHAHSYYPSYLWNDYKHFPLKNEPPVPGHSSLAKGADSADPRSYDVFKGQDYAPDRINEQALKFVRDNKDRPFCLYYPTVIPHVALHVPDAELKPYLDLEWKDPPFTRDGGYGYTPHFTPRAAYAAMISRMDRYIGNLLNLLDELKLADNTIVVFSSDNGTTHLDKEVDYTFFKSVGELRGLKGSLYEGGVRVPTLVRWPGHVKAGSSNDRISGFEDWMPTLLELTGGKVKAPANIDGISLAPTLLGNEQEDRPFLYREFPSYGGQQTIRVGDWKAVRQNMTRGNMQVELYNIANDIGEKHDVADENPGIVKDLVVMMKSERVPSEIFPLRPIDAPAIKPRKK
jgi:arylsulfatase A